MSPRDASGSPRQTRWQFLLGVLLVAAVVIFRWGYSSPVLAAKIVLEDGYWIIGATFVLFVLVARRELLAHWPGWRSLRAHRMGLVVALLGGLYWQVHEPHDFKILFDEHVLAGMAYDMHFSRIASIPSTTHLVNDRLYTISHQVDKRPLFYPFLVSLVHDFTGYRPQNSFVVNGLVGVLLLLLVYALGAALGGWRVGCLGQILLIGLPLLAQCATGGGFDLLYSTLLCAQLLAAWNYWRQPGSAGLDLWVMTAMLQANCRYEGMLYFGFFPLLIAAKWARERRITLSWCAALLPVLVLLPLLNHEIFSSGGSGNHFFQTNQENFINLSHVPDNFSHAIYFLFSPDRELNNSVLLSAVGVVALLLTLVGIGRRILTVWKQPGPELPLLFLILGALANTFLMWCLFWGHWDESMVSRFALPLCMTFSWCAMYVAAQWIRRRPIPNWFLITLGIYAVISSAPVSSWAFETNDQEAYQSFSWARDYVLSHADLDTLIIARSTLMFTLYGRPSAPLGSANAAPEKLINVKKLGFYHDVWVIQEVTLNAHLNAWVELPAARLDRRVKLETIAEYPIRPETHVRISRVVGYDASQPGGTAVLQGELNRTAESDSAFPAWDYPPPSPNDKYNLISVRPADEPPAVDSMTELPTGPDGLNDLDRKMMEQLP
jgi:Flp pilus assembly protein protease CpaA